MKTSSIKQSAVLDVEHGADGRNNDTPSQGATVKDPVCGMTVNTATANWSLRHADATYHFCSNGCLGKFCRRPGEIPGAARRAIHYAT
jgi:Cu+-exporting ATPase